MWGPAVAGPSCVVVAAEFLALRGFARSALLVVRPSMTDLPIVCTLTPETVQTRKAGLLPRLMARAVERLDVTNGYRVRFSPGGGLLETIAQVVDAERQCCRFLTFQISVEPDGGPVWLELTGPPGTRDFLDALLDFDAGS